jgi:general L-amino acid transport system ATP-binding protein
LKIIILEGNIFLATAKHAILIKNIHKYYGKFHVLRGISLQVKKGEIVAIIGPSGSGKSTLIRTINCLETFQQGQIYVNDIEIKKSNKLAIIRQKVGFISQEFNLFPHLTIRNNITLAPNQIQQLKLKQCNAIADQLLTKLNIYAQAEKFPDQLSRGEQQRACIARALAMQPEIILFDEPTSALDPTMTIEILTIIKNLADSGLTILIVTHTEVVTKIANKIFLLHSGQIINNTTNYLTDFFSAAKTKNLSENTLV